MKWSLKLAKHRAERRMSQAELAGLVGLQDSRISRWENGDGNPSMAQGLRLARALGVSYDYLADDALDEPPGLSELQVEVLKAAERVGYDRALSRIMAGPEPETPPGRETHGGDRRARDGERPA